MLWRLDQAQWRSGKHLGTAKGSRINKFSNQLGLEACLTGLGVHSVGRGNGGGEAAHLGTVAAPDRTGSAASAWSGSAQAWGTQGLVWSRS